MVGQTIIKEGTLDVKPPANASFTRGWRFQPWKTRQVKLVDENGIVELHIYKGADLKKVYVLENITDITMVASKTHLYAFEVIASSETVVILSGQTEIESRDWIWALRRIFWPQALAEIVKDEKIQLQLAPNIDSRRLGLETGIYGLDVTVSSISINFLSKCQPRDSRLTPVEPFTGTESVRTISIPLTVIGRFKLDRDEDGHSVTIETLPEYMHGKISLILQQTDDADEDQNIVAVMDVLKNKVFKATNNLHECIASTQWRLSAQD